MAAMKLSRELLPVPFFNVSNKHRILDLKKTLGTRNSAPGFSSRRIVSQKSYTRHQIRARHLAPYLLYCRIYKHQTHWQNIKRYTSTILLNIFNFKPPLGCLFIFSSSLIENEKISALTLIWGYSYFSWIFIGLVSKTYFFVFFFLFCA